jgi:hypothetical protein
VLQHCNTAYSWSSGNALCVMHYLVILLLPYLSSSENPCIITYMQYYLMCYKQVNCMPMEFIYPSISHFYQYQEEHPLLPLPILENQTYQKAIPHSQVSSQNEIHQLTFENQKLNCHFLEEIYVSNNITCLEGPLSHKGQRGLQRRK